MSPDRILVVHRHEDETQHLRLFLEVQGFEGHFVTGACDALELLDGFTPAAVLIHVGRGEGAELHPLRRLVAPLGFLNVPVVALGDALSVETAGTLRAMGCRAVVEHPHPTPALAALLGRFRVLPLRRSAAARPREGRAPAVLVVEDEPALRTLMRRVLERSGFSVLVAPTGQAALALAGAHPGRLDLLVVDLRLPDTDGAALARQLRAAEPGLRVIVTSGYVEEDEARAMADDATVVLHKPFAISSFDRAVGDLLGAA